MKPQEYLKTKGISENEVIRVNGNIVTVCELLKEFAGVKVDEFGIYLNKNNPTMLYKPIVDSFKKENL